MFKTSTDFIIFFERDFGLVEIVDIVKILFHTKGVNISNYNLLPYFFYPLFFFGLILIPLFSFTLSLRVKSTANIIPAIPVPIPIIPAV
jgi:hypothetical protein